MTTIDAAAAWRVTEVRHARQCSQLSWGSALAVARPGRISSRHSGDPQCPPRRRPRRRRPPARRSPKIAIAPVIGAPDTVAKQLQAQLTTAIESQQVTVAKPPNDKAEYTLRGYVVSAREKTKTKVSYIWDVTDQTGKRVNRITGEEVVAGAQGKDPWASVTPQSSTPSPTRPRARSPPGCRRRASRRRRQRRRRPATRRRSAAAESGATAGAAAAVRPPRLLRRRLPPPQLRRDRGDPDHRQHRSRRRRRERHGAERHRRSRRRQRRAHQRHPARAHRARRRADRQGLARRPTASKARSSVGEGKDGKQPIQIDWNVKDPKGKKLGTVSQKNEIPQGSLDGAWGKTADAAAAAAAQGILKLLPQQTKTN